MEKTLRLGKIEGGGEGGGATEEEMVGWHHPLNGHEFEQTPGDGEGQGSLACCRRADTTEQLNKNCSQIPSYCTQLGRED